MWLWGGFAVDSATLNRFYSLHYLLPFMIAGVVVLHIWALHVAGQNNPLGIDVKSKEDTVAFTPYATIKDTFATVLFLVLFAWLVFFLPNYLGHPDNYIPADSLKTPAHIVPEWYFLPFYAILRAIPNKLLGVIALFACDRGAVLPALARYVAGALGGLPPDLPPVLLDLRPGLLRPRLSRLAAGGGRLCHRLAHPDRLLLPALPGHHAGPRPDRAAEAAAGQHHRSGAREIGAWRAGARRGRRIVSLFRKDPAAVTRAARHGLIAMIAALGVGLGAFQAAAQDEGAGHGDAAAEGEAETMHYPLKKPELLDWSFAGVFGTYDRGAAPARLPGLPRGLLAVPRAQVRRLPQPRRSGRPGLQRGAGRRARRGVRDRRRPERKRRDVHPARPSVGPFPEPVPQRPGRRRGLWPAPPDLSLMAKARGAPRGPLWTVLDFFTQYQEAGPNYIHALLTGYGQEPPARRHGAAGRLTTIPISCSGPAIAMPPPLADGDVKYTDGSPRTVDQYSQDVSAFLMWTAEPHLVARKRLGFQVIIFLAVFATLMYLTKRRVWAAVAH